MRNACLTCQHRGTVPNSRHSSCKHPRVEDIMSSGEDLLRVMDGLVNHSRVPYLYDNLKVLVNEAAIGEGWCTWPFNFDPIWIIDCTGFEEAEK